MWPTVNKSSVFFPYIIGKDPEGKEEKRRRWWWEKKMIDEKG
jgi:hypothetical protein